jgi:hypothetical protein
MIHLVRWWCQTIRLWIEAHFVPLSARLDLAWMNLPIFFDDFYDRMDKIKGMVIIILRMGSSTE